MNWQDFLATFSECGGEYHPAALQALSYFWRGVETAGDLLRVLALVDSDNLAVGECLLRSLPGISI